MRIGGRRFAVLLGVAVAVGAGASLVFGQGLGLLSYGGGLACFASSLLGLWGLAQGLTPKEGRSPYWLIGLAALFLHLPAFVWVASAIQRAGGPGPACFLSGGALVYCFAVGWVLARPR